MKPFQLVINDDNVQGLSLRAWQWCNEQKQVSLNWSHSTYTTTGVEIVYCNRQAPETISHLEIIGLALYKGWKGF